MKPVKTMTDKLILSGFFVAFVTYVYLVYPETLRLGSHKPTGPQKDLNPKQDALMVEEQKAEAQHDFRHAEAICKQMINAGQREQDVNRILYGLYEQEGRLPEAYKAMKSFMKQTPILSSDQIDPVMIVQYGYLAEQVGRKQEAESVYRNAYRLGFRYLSPKFYPELTKGSCFSEVKSAAFFIAAIKQSFQGHHDQAIWTMKVEVRFNPISWKTHFGLTFVLREDLGKSDVLNSFKEAKTTLKLAPTAMAAILSHELKSMGIPDGSDKVYIATTDIHDKLHVSIGHLRKP